jgi:hypothetical protein
MPNLINADNGVVSGFAGVRTTADGTGNLALQTNGNTVLTLNTANVATFANNVTVTGTLTTASQGITSASLPAGTILQVQSFTFTGTTAIAASAFTDTGVTVSITPKFSTSKILVLATLQCSGPATIYFKINLVRNSTTIAQPSYMGNQPSTANSYVGDLGIASEVYNVSINYLDSPATTSATTYKLQGSVASGTGYVNTRADSIGNQISSITVMEIAV